MGVRVVLKMILKILLGKKEYYKPSITYKLISKYNITFFGGGMDEVI